VELLTSAFGNVAEQKLATVFWFTVNWARVNAGQANEVSVVVDGLRICAWFSQKIIKSRILRNERTCRQRTGCHK
jgi:hypothetical protein